MARTKQAVVNRVAPGIRAGGKHPHVSKLPAIMGHMGARAGAESDESGIAGKFPRSHLEHPLKLKLPTPASVGGIRKKPHRWRPGTVALREIRKYQKSTENLIERLPIERVIREIMSDYSIGCDANGDDLTFRIKPAAIDALQVAAEAHLIGVLGLANEIACHSKQKTLMVRHLSFAVHVLELLGKSGTR